MMTNKIKIAVIDDQRLFREGLSALLKNVEDFELLAEPENGKEFLEIVKTLPGIPDVVLVDMNMPEMNGVELTDILQREYPDMKIIILTVYNQERFINKMVESGVSGYLLKNCDIEDVILAIRAAHRTGFYFNDAVVKALRNSHKYKSSEIRNLSNVHIDLTDREKEILQLICKELTNTEIAEQLHISARTVDGHRNNLLSKTGCRNTAGLVLFAVTNGIHKLVNF
jgi:DNA-binding NarL/FixJ family response regulator